MLSLAACVQEEDSVYLHRLAKRYGPRQVTGVVKNFTILVMPLRKKPGMDNDSAKS